MVEIKKVKFLNIFKFIIILNERCIKVNIDEIFLKQTHPNSVSFNNRFSELINLLKRHRI